ncbi:hypothetical protein [Pseudanabaena sp. FACHB-2040]|uniref:hypothetical protein n=1 Tax=Pseudanabaena sp. FACHB-2040 TaxID=2692859 RepID=UPI0016869CEC|nr:hypothetical protein [Pseudanabaena sp. FACHB-2040]MBD2256028.1 hypothetical protein [Pseudanabaena sp. FACHB-2040]
MTTHTQPYNLEVQDKIARLQQDAETLLSSILQQIEANQPDAQQAHPSLNRVPAERSLQPLYSVPARIRQPLAA